jgi:glutamate synthase (NADPH/NADH) small chain
VKGSADNKNFVLKTDHVLKAIGQLLTDDSQNLEIEGSKIKVNALFETSVNNVWAGGDCVSAGDDLTVTAVAQGRDAAENIHSKLMGEA